jgi:hypothetical protein
VQGQGHDNCSYLFVFASDSEEKQIGAADVGRYATWVQNFQSHSDPGL